jgi:chromosome segregation protein
MTRWPGQKTMRLKKLVLQGYKTFASKTEFLFDEGITSIVGPNGSGKSNVADAVRWVLGEQSYGALRGKRTTDMIFAGSQTRPRAGMAQAILTLDNADGWLPIDYTEVEIGRRAYRSGENEYILNGQKVRLKDIADLLATSGLAERTYTIIGQGLVDQALSLRAEERRALFEEAAGINHYKSRRAETLRRLTETQHNLERVHDILAEIGPRMNSLKRQAVRARNYEQVAADLHHLLRIWYGYKWEQAKREMRQARETAVSTEKVWQTTRLNLLAQQDKIDAVRRRLNQLQEQTAVTRSQRDDIRDQLEKARRQVAILQERQESLQRQLADVAQELPDLEQQRERAQIRTGRRHRRTGNGAGQPATKPGRTAPVQRQFPAAAGGNYPLAKTTWAGGIRAAGRAKPAGPGRRTAQPTARAPERANGRSLRQRPR